MLFVLPARVCAYNYGEHKAIGDEAFIKFVRSLQQSDRAVTFLSLRDLKLGGTNISFGTLNGLSGDHVGDPYALIELLKTNAINMYVTLHLVAMDWAAQSGRLKDKPEEARTLMRFALLFNGFADHFLEDSFSSGHLVVKRTVVASVVQQ